MTWLDKLIQKLTLRSFYITFEWTDKEGNRIQSWQILHTVYNLNNSKQLLEFIRIKDKELKNYYITWFKELRR